MGYTASEVAESYRKKELAQEKRNRRRRAKEPRRMLRTDKAIRAYDKRQKKQKKSKPLPDQLIPKTDVYVSH